MNKGKEVSKQEEQIIYQTAVHQMIPVHSMCYKVDFCSCNPLWVLTI